MGPPPFGDGNNPAGPASGTWRGRFNGATAFRRWKRPTKRVMNTDFPLLQWGHRLSAMETGPVPSLLTARTRLQWGHRLSAMETTDPNPRCWRCDKLQWGHRLSAMETPGHPRPGGCQLGLQWGHRLSAMETLRLLVVISAQVVASMGPPPFGDGNAWAREIARP